MDEIEAKIPELYSRVFEAGMSYLPAEDAVSLAEEAVGVYLELHELRGPYEATSSVWRGVNGE